MTKLIGCDLQMLIMSRKQYLHFIGERTLQFSKVEKVIKTIPIQYSKARIETMNKTQYNLLISKSRSKFKYWARIHGLNIEHLTE